MNRTILRRRSRFIARSYLCCDEQTNLGRQVFPKLHSAPIFGDRRRQVQIYGRLFLRSLETNTSKTKSQTMNVRRAKSPLSSIPDQHSCSQSRWQEKSHELLSYNTRETARKGEEFGPLRRWIGTAKARKYQLRTLISLRANPETLMRQGSLVNAEDCWTRRQFTLLDCPVGREVHPRGWTCETRAWVTLKNQGVL